MDVIGVTNRVLCSNFLKRIAEIKENVNLKYLILREKDLSNSDLENLALKVKNILKDSNIKLIINNNIKVSKNIGASGVQLSFNKIKELNIKELNLIVGVSVHSLEEAIISEKLGASYIIYGHVFETDCKKGLKPRGVNELKEICSKINIPVYAIGGINKNNYKDVINVGVQGFAIMSSLMENKELDYLNY